jgi:hypothetical protein
MQVILTELIISAIDGNFQVVMSADFILKVVVEREIQWLLDVFKINLLCAKKDLYILKTHNNFSVK